MLVIVVFEDKHFLEAFVGKTCFLPKLARDEDTYCHHFSENEFRCWKLHRLRKIPIPSTTVLWDVLEQPDIEVPMVINGDHKSFLMNNEGSSSTSTSSETTTKSDYIEGIDLKDLDVPQPTDNGGYTHTAASKQKIGAANKGKVPWNKGRQRSPEERARIAAGVRASNRERFLVKLKDLGLTEEEYQEKNKAERRAKDAERRARRTEKGGYRPTDETRAKISKILKEKHARGEIKRKAVDPSKVRRGFTHSEETRRKISESLRNRWQKDTDYREMMTKNMKDLYSREEARKKISESLKKKWQDPEFRNEMLAKMNSRRKSPEATDAYRQKISNTMKKKWQDPAYRERTINGILKHKESLGIRPKAKPKPKTKRRSTPKGSTKAKSVLEEARMVEPLSPDRVHKEEVQKRKTTRSSSTATAKVVAPRTNSESRKAPVKKKRATTIKKKKEPDGSVNRLREERRDLFDLLYGDEPLRKDNTAGEEVEKDADIDHDSLIDNLASRFDFDDEDLDSFDPYGLDDY